ncbi:MAG: hypothetical protein WC635_02955 [Bacteriovorax sp.]
MKARIKINFFTTSPNLNSLKYSQTRAMTKVGRTNQLAILVIASLTIRMVGSSMRSIS